MPSPHANPADRPATAARIYDYLLGGVHNFPADREVAEKALAEMPFVRESALINRALLGRMVRHLAAAGIDQFLDIGSGIPTGGNVHEVAQEVAPGARVVYVDIDPVAVAESLDLLEGNDRATAIRGDLRDPAAVLAHPEVRRLLDFDRPVGLLLVAVLHFVGDDTLAYAGVARLLDTLAVGSYLVATHGATESMGIAVADSTSGQAYGQATPTGLPRPRTQTEFAQFFAGLELVEPGIVWLPEWRPLPGDRSTFADDPMASRGWAGMGRKV